MALIVEDGTGKADANAYISVVDADTYMADFLGSPATWTALDSAGKEDAIREGTQYLDLKYGARWKGLRSNSGQALNWPRQNIVDRDGFTILSTVMPVDLVRADAEAAFESIGETAGLLSKVTDNGIITKESAKIGPLSESIEYSGGKSPLPRFPKIDSLVSEFIEVAGEVVRA